MMMFIIIFTPFLVCKSYLFAFSKFPVTSGIGRRKTSG
ncbi:hypothetical protein B4168_1005 [Anoxybacillus flavithermus]|nr:hypothetical protein B4168_1005 [Anoxybacillus flavithermus]OAO87012.1 hypothetical protein GT23_2030 [Parageobacillus thermoglucosidasius]